MGWPHPDYLTSFLTGEQLSGWLDYSSREPFGFAVDDIRWSMLTATVANAAGPEEPFTQEQFMLGPSLADPLNEDGTPTEETLALKLQQLIPPNPKPTEGA